MASANAIPLFSPRTWTGVSGNPSTTHLHQKIVAQEQLFDSQLPATKQLLQIEARQIADALINGSKRLVIQFPESVICWLPGQNSFGSVEVPQPLRKQTVGGWLAALQQNEIIRTLSDKLGSLEIHSDPALSTAAQLLRFEIAHWMIYDLLPSGKPVTYQTVEGEEIPSILSDGTQDVPYPERFFQPQWISFDDRGYLLTNSILEAEDNMAAMQRYLKTLQMAAFIDPFMVADCEYQRKRYGILGQMVNQGRSLGRYWTFEIIAIIHRKLDAGKLDRGLRLSMPYFDERDLCMKMYDFEVIPTGRVSFLPSFVVVSARNEQEKVFRNPRFSFGTRKYLLIQLDILEQAFQTDDPHSLREFAEQPA